MRRRLLIVAIFLLAGAVVNVAVAWGLGSCRSAWPAVEEARKIAEDMGFAPNVDAVIPRHDTWYIDGGSVITFVGLLINKPSPPGELVAIVGRVQAGWPAHTMRGYTMRVVDTGGAEEYRWAFSVREDEPPVPLLPIWPGFAVNTAFYAAILSLLTAGLFALRRFIRVRRGLCPACAYPRGESNVCSECGKPLAGRMTVAA